MEKIFIDPDNVDYSLIKKAAQAIREGKIAAFPTETVYGVGCRADNKAAVSRLYAIKKRPKDKPFALALSRTQDSIESYFAVLPPFGYRLMEKFWPGPLTIIYNTDKDKKVGVRVPSHVIANEILKELNLAVYLPSANISGQKDSITASEVEKAFSDKVDLIVDSGACVYSKASTVVDLTYSPFKIVREGAISEKGVISAFVRKRVLFVCAGNSVRSLMAQFILEKYLSRERVHFDIRYEIISRGISLHQELEAPPYVVDILKEKEGIDLSVFNVKALDKQAILSSDLIFTMEEAQTAGVLELEPTAEGRVFTLRKFLPPELDQDIPDPIGKDKAFYENVYSLIKEAVLELRDWV